MTVLSSPVSAPDHQILNLCSGVSTPVFYSLSYWSTPEEGFNLRAHDFKCVPKYVVVSIDSYSKSWVRQIKLLAPDDIWSNPRNLLKVVCSLLLQIRAKIWIPGQGQPRFCKKLRPARQRGTFSRLITWFRSNETCPSVYCFELDTLNNSSSGASLW